MAITDLTPVDTPIATRITCANGAVLSPVIPDDAGQIQAYLDSLANFNDVRPWGGGNPSGDNYLPQEMRWNAEATPAMGDTTPLRLRLNTIYYPTGATRWGVACFVVAGDWGNLPPNQKATIQFGSVTLSEWWLVHVRQITTDLAIVILADDRYRWRWARTPTDYTFTESTTWSEVISMLGSALGRSISYPSIDYTFPDAVELTRRCVSIAEMVEAVALSMGLRVTLKFDGSIVFEQASESQYEGDRHWPIPHQAAIIGRKVNVLIPDRITVAFTRAQSGAFDQTGRVYSKSYQFREFQPTQALAQSDGETGLWRILWTGITTSLTSADVVIRCTYPAEYRTLGSEPANQEELDRLACRIIRDCYRWIVQQTYDITHPGIIDHPIRGCDDFICWVIGDRGPSWQAGEKPEYLVATRYAARPVNVLPDTIYAGEGKQRYSGSGVMRVVLDEPLNQYGETRCKLVRIDTAGGLSIDDRTIKVTKPNHPLVIGPMPDSGRFEFLSAEVNTGNEVNTNTNPTTTAQDCTGRTKWNWDGYEWTVLTNECGQASTTTAGAVTTVGPTTTTTAAPTTTCSSLDPCCALVSTTAAGTTTAGATTTTTTAAPTTTASGGCRPQYPTFCPDVSDVGACTWTFCADGESLPPSCQTTTAAPTTTASGTGPPTTTAAPTTTAGCPADCVCPTGPGGCHWISVPIFGGGWQWQLFASTCCSVCPCEAPAREPVGCDEDFTDCKPLPAPPGPPSPYCIGGCEFWWIPLLGRWVKTRETCVGFLVSYCNCVEPTVDGDVCAPIITRCKSPATTTAAPNPLGPCFPTTTAGATTTAAPTTTPACGIGCYWECASAVWTIADNLCNPGCECYEPPIGCTENCEREFTACRSTTTAGPTTTAGVTSTPTTTVAPTTTAGACGTCDGQSFWRWTSNADLTRGSWQLDAGGSAQCVGGCQPAEPERAGAYRNEIAAGTCKKPCFGVGVCNYHSFDGITWTYSSTSGQCNPANNCGCAPPSYAPTLLYQNAKTICACV